jgi:hypothetical protein
MPADFLSMFYDRLTEKGLFVDILATIYFLLLTKSILHLSISSGKAMIRKSAEYLFIG